MSDVIYETYISDEGDMVDMIAYRRFGDSTATAAILDANPGLAALGPVLERGVVIRIPVPIKKDRSQSTRLWS